MNCCREPVSAMLEADIFNSVQGLIMLLLVLLLTSLFAHHLLFSGALVSNLQDKYVLITGCDSGFGHELAVRLDERGLSVFATCLTRDGEEKLREKCSQRLKAFHLDVSKTDMVQTALEYVKTHLPPARGLWAIVNNAGVAGGPGPIEWHTLENMKRVVDVNLWGMVDVTKRFLPLLKQCRGRIINVASSLGRFSLPGAAAYSISKFGVQAFSDALRNEARLFGVSVHIIEPGFFKTNLTDPMKQTEHFEQTWGELSTELKESYGMEFYQEGKKRTGKFLSLISSSDTNKVVEAMEHAVLSASPKVRYIVGWDHWLFLRPLSFLPSRVQDIFLGIFLPKPSVAKAEL